MDNSAKTDEQRRNKVLVVDSMHLFKDSEGTYYSPVIYNDDFFARYLNVFDQLSLIAKVRIIDDCEKEKYIKINTKRITVCELPWYQGIKNMFRMIMPLIKVYKKAVRDCDCYIFRVLQIESMFAFIFRERKKPYVVEVVNDPESWQEFGMLMRKVLSAFLRQMINCADGASYVTKCVLQKKYPKKEKKGKKIFTSYYSSVELLKSDIMEPKQYPDNMDKITIIHVANTVNGNGKGHKTVLDIVCFMKKSGIEVEARFIGDGPSVIEFKELSRKLGIEEQVIFMGRISERKKLLEEIRKADIFVFPTYSEGLPRCIIEACAVGVPCLSTPVAGIPELLDAEYLFEPDDVIGFVTKIEELMNEPSKLEEMSKKNVVTAMQYEKGILSERRYEFYCKLLHLLN